MYSQKCTFTGNLSKASNNLYKEDLPTSKPDTVDNLRALHPEGDLNYNKQLKPTCEQEADFWESEDGKNLMLDVLSLSETKVYFRK